MKSESPGDRVSVNCNAQNKSAASSLLVGFHTFGCRSNYADTIALQELVAARGGTPCGLLDGAEVVVLNSCTVTDEADREILKTITKIKERSPSARVIVTGCMAEVSRERLIEEGKADAVVGINKREELIQEIWSLQTKNDSRLEGQDFGDVQATTVGPGEFLGKIKSRSRFHLRIQEGCEESCTYCIIPNTRGGFRSREISQILSDVEKLSKLGYSEIILTGTHIGGYGEDIKSSFYSLLREISGQEHCKRIRLSSIDPNNLSHDIIDLIADSEVFCRHLHVCVQSFSDLILKKMNRRYRLADIVRLLCYISDKLPGCGIGGDLICGFPGESREEVEEEIKSFLSLPFSYLHVFPYSERENTAATRLTDVVDVGERRRRAARWRALSDEKARAFHQGFVGKSVEAVIEANSETDNSSQQEVFGTTREFASVKVINATPGDLKVGRAYQLRVIEYDLLGKILQCVH